MSKRGVAGRLQALGVGTWEYASATGSLELDPVAQQVLSMPSRLHWSDFVKRVRKLDRGSLGMGSRRPGAVTRARFCVVDGSGALLEVEALGTHSDGGAVGTVSASQPAPEATGFPVETWFGQFADALSTTLTPADVTRAVNTLGEEVLGARFLGLSVKRDHSMAYLMAKPLPVAADREWGVYPMDSVNPIPQVYRDGVAKAYSTRGEMLAEYPNLEIPISEAGVEAWAGLPMVASNRSVGVMVVHWGQARELDAHAVRELSVIAALVAQTLERALLVERRENAMNVLQQVVLPAALPEVPDLELAARYLPTDTGVEVGGDWYDAFTTRGGEIALVVGDVLGHGLQAAASMGQLRNAVRAYSAEGKRPAEVLSGLNRLALAEDGTYATVLCALLDPTTGTLEWASAGHMPPIVEVGGRTEVLDGEPDTLVGARDGQEFSSHTTTLAAGATLALYSDGLVKGRADGIEPGVARLVEGLARRNSTSLDVRCSKVLDGVLGDQERGDDLCLLLVRRRGDDELRASHSFAQGLRTPQAARGFLSEVLTEWDLPELEDTALLLLSEAVTNAVIHARSKVRVTVRRDAEFLAVNVHDLSPIEPIRRSDSLEAVNGRGVALIDILSHEWGVDFTAGGKDLWFTLPVDGVSADGLLEEV